MNDMKVAGLETGERIRPDPAYMPVGEAVFRDGARWTRVNEAATVPELAAAWLELQCSMIADAREGVLLLGDENGRFAPAAAWPDGTAAAPSLVATAEVALAERRGVLGEMRDGVPSLAYPLLSGDELSGAVAVALAPRMPVDLKPAMRQLQWGVAFIRERLRRLDRDAAARRLDRLKTILDFLATTLEHDGFMPAARAFVTRLAIDCGAERVAIGFYRRGSVRVAAISHSAQFGHEMNLVRLLSDAMNESVDQQALILFPPQAEGDPVATSAHVRLAAEHRIGHILTIPLLVADRFVGALTLESPADRPFGKEIIELLDGACAVVGPILEEKRLNDRWIGRKIGESVGRQLSRMFGPSHLGRKLAAAVAVAIVAFFSVTTGAYRVSADAELQGLIRRSIVAPTDGFIKSAAARAGDTVHAGDELAALDDRDLALQRLRWVTERQQHLYEHDKALAARELATVNVVKSQVDQANAEIKLIDEQLARSKLTAPFDGIIVSGDLSQSIGAPVPRGQVLFEIAPLNGYRVNIAVDEREVADIAVGQKGEILTASLPGESFGFVVEKITPIAEQKNGRNVFRVEGRLTDNPERLRPGMEGIAKIDVDRRLLIAVWARPLIDWARVGSWAWLP